MCILFSGRENLLGPAPTGTGTIALDPTFGSSTLIELVSHRTGFFGEGCV